MVYVKVYLPGASEGIKKGGAGINLHRLDIFPKKGSEVIEDLIRPGDKLLQFRSAEGFLLQQREVVDVGAECVHFLFLALGIEL